MEAAFESAGPLAPSMWGFSAADVQQQANLLDLNFAGVAREYQAPYAHPIADAWETHPVHTLAFNKRQFDVLRYGMVLDEAAGLVLVSAPGELVDSGILVAQEYASLCKAPLADPEKAVHPLLAEYTLLVYRCTPRNAATEEMRTEMEKERPELLFRLVFRNEAYQQDARSLMDWNAFFPMFRLRAVYVSSNLVYPHVSELARYRQSNPPYLLAADGTRTANPRVQEMLFRHPLLTLCDLWMKVLNSVVPPLPRKLRHVDLEADALDVFFTTHQMLVNGTATNAATPACEPGYGHSGAGFIPRRISLAYLSNMDRQQRRITVAPRTPTLLRSWRDGEMDMHYVRHKALQGRFLPSVQAEETEKVRSPCVRMLLLPERKPLNVFDGNELCAYLPPREEYASPTVYRTEAAECLRLWILKGLVLAELLHLHVLFLELDPVLILSQCSGLLWDDHEDVSRDSTSIGADATREDRRRTVFYLCKIAIETIEDFLQHSGVVWRVVVGVHDDQQLPNVSLCGLCEEIATFVRVARMQLEVSRMEAIRGEEESNQSSITHDRAVATRSQSAYCAALVNSLRSAYASGALTIYENAPSRLGAPVAPSHAFQALRDAHDRELPPSTVYNAASARVYLFDRDLFPIFVALCGPHSDEVPVKTLVEVLQLKLDPQQETKYPTIWPFEHPLIPLDHCGVPYSTARLTAFVANFAMKSFTAGPEGRPTTEPAEPTLNYVEFSMLMLHLATQ